MLFLLFHGVNEGIGIHTDLVSGAGRPINGAIAETVIFSFDRDVWMTSLRLGSFSANEVVTLTRSAGTTITLTGVSGQVSSTFDQKLGDGFAYVAAGSTVTFTTTNALGAGVLFNEITINTVPEPAAGLPLFLLSMLALGRRKIG